MARIYFLMLSVLGLLIFSCSNKPETISPAIKNITESVYASGFIKSKNQYEVFGRSNGIIKKVFVTENTPVKKGDPIFELESRDFKLATENARLASSTADYIQNIDKLKHAEKAIAVAKKQLQNDSLLYERQNNLWSNNIGSKVDLEQRELNFANSKANVASAISNYGELQRQMKLLSDQSKNSLEIAKLMEDDFIVRSEVDGVVYQVNKEVGELINRSQPAAIIGTDEFILELSIDEFDIVKVKKGQKVIIRMDSYESEIFEATIIAIDPIMNIRTRSFQAEAIFTRKPATLYPNLTAEANILINTKKDALTIPRNFLVNDTTVILKGGKMQSVRTGLMDYDLVEIESGLDANSTIELPQ